MNFVALTRPGNKKITYVNLDLVHIIDQIGDGKGSLLWFDEVHRIDVIENPDQVLVDK